MNSRKRIVIAVIRVLSAAVLLWLLSIAADAPLEAANASTVNTPVADAAKDNATEASSHKNTLAPAPAAESEPGVVTSSCTEPVTTPEYDAWVRSVEESLNSSKEPDTLIAAALISFARLPPQELTPEMQSDLARHALDTFQKAGARARNDAGIMWLAVTLCTTVSGCDPTEYEVALRSIDPKNSAGWIGAVLRSIEQKDYSAVLNAMNKMIAAGRFEDYWAMNVTRLVRALDGVGVTPPRNLPPHFTSARELAVYNWSASFPRPEYPLLLDRCVDAEFPALKRRCRQLSEQMRRSGSLQAYELGLKLERGMAESGELDLSVAPTEAEKKAAKADVQYRWQRLQLSALPQAFDRFLEAFRVHGSEIQAMRSLLRDNAIPLEARFGWEPDKPIDGCAVMTTGVALWLHAY